MKIARQIHSKTNNSGDDLFSVQHRSHKIIYSHETALFLLRLSDRSPLSPSVTVPSSYNASEPVKNKCKIYYVKPELLELGKTTLPSGMGNDITCYDAERTICDIMRSRSRIDAQIFTDALKKYAARPDANLNRLNEYAILFSVQKLLRRYLEVLL